MTPDVYRTFIWFSNLCSFLGILYFPLAAYGTDSRMTLFGCGALFVVCLTNVIDVIKGCMK